jgi:hypothetical protein
VPDSTKLNNAQRGLLHRVAQFVEACAEDGIVVVLPSGERVFADDLVADFQEMFDISSLPSEVISCG